MKGKKKLVKLINEYTENITARELHSADFDEKFADYLLANIGVIPPCKVGDTAYLLTTNGAIQNLTVTDINIILRKNETSIICNAVFERDGRPCYIELVPSKIGKIYFFSLEDAEREKALQYPSLDEQLAVAEQKAGTRHPDSKFKENER